jgi:hypothetical protein
MLLVYGLSLMVLGVLSASSLIVQKRPDAKEMIEKLARYQGTIGVVAAVWGAYVLLRSILNLASIHLPFLHWATSVAIGAVLLGNGFLLGYGLAMTWVKDPTAKAKAEEAYQKLVPYQTKLGLAAIALGLWGVLASFLR